MAKLVFDVQAATTLWQGNALRGSERSLDPGLLWHRVVKAVGIVKEASLSFVLILRRLFRQAVPSFSFHEEQWLLLSLECRSPLLLGCFKKLWSFGQLMLCLERLVLAEPVESRIRLQDRSSKVCLGNDGLLLHKGVDGELEIQICLDVHLFFIFVALVEVDIRGHAARPRRLLAHRPVLLESQATCGETSPGHG